MRKRSLRAVLGLTTALTIVLAGCGTDSPEAGVDSGPSESSSPGADSDSGAAAEAAASWLAQQLEDGLVVSSFENPPGSGEWSSSPDYGLSLDVFFALQGRDELADERAGILDSIEPQVDNYVGRGQDAYAGSIGKLLTAVQADGAAVTDYASGDLLPRLEGLVVQQGDEEGRAKDTWAPSNELGGDYSNTIGQSWVARALTEADSELADESVSFLLAQQCSEGYFRLPMESSDFTCDSGAKEESRASADATAFAVLALLEVQDAELSGVEGDEEAAVAAARKWLLAEQASDGSFADADTGKGNANSTGVAAEALLALGETEAAAEAATWLAEHQVNEDTADTAELTGEAGAVAYDAAALRKAEKKGIGRADLYQWRRATAQAVVALDVLP